MSKTLMSHKPSQDIICTVIAALLSAIVAWSFVSSTTAIRWLGSDALAASQVDVPAQTTSTGHAEG